MGDKTKIEWTRGPDGPGSTWNPTTGCTRVSAGCDHCYAIGVAHRFAGDPAGPYAGTTERTEAGPDWSGRLNLLAHRLDQPLRWTRPRFIFVNSVSDLFHDQVPDLFIVDVFAVMALAQHHTFQILTKRHARMRALLTSPAFRSAIDWRLAEWTVYGPEQFKAAAAGSNLYVATDAGWPLPNVWLGVSVESQQWANRRIPALLHTPAAVRCLSYEPLLGAVSLSPWLTPGMQLLPGTVPLATDLLGPVREVQRREYRPGIDWVVAGGESGPRSRPMDPTWARLLRVQCTDAEIPFFFKQWGDWRPAAGWSNDRNGRQRIAYDAELDMVKVGKKFAGRQLDGRQWDERPERVLA